MPISASLQLRQDREHLVRRFIEIELQPLAGAVHVGEGARHIDEAALVPVRKVAHHGALFVGPEAADPGIFGMKRLDGGSRAVDGDTHIPQPFDEPGQQLVGILELDGARHEPIPQRNGLAQGLGSEVPGGCDLVGEKSGGETSYRQGGFQGADLQAREKLQTSIGEFAPARSFRFDRLPREG